MSSILRREALLAVFLASFCLPLSCAAAAARAGDDDVMGKIQCHPNLWYEEYKTSGGRQDFSVELSDGYTLTIGRTPGNAGLGDGEDCTAEIHDRSGALEFSETTFSIVFVPKQTGRDFDGDKHADLVLLSDTGNGATGCCWSYNVISLFRKPHKLFDVENALAARFEWDKQGRVAIWQPVVGPYGITDGADTPHAMQVLRVQDGRLRDVTPQYCRKILNELRQSDDWNTRLAPANVQRAFSLIRVMPNGTWTIESDDEITIGALLSRTLQNIYCSNFDAALRDVDQWPTATRVAVKRSFANLVRQDFPEFSTRLMATHPHK